MGITRLYIENFKSIRKVDIDLRPINILIGANGAGKSNFISFFKLLNMMYNQQLQRYVKQQAGASNILYFGMKNSIYLSGEIEFGAWNCYKFQLTTDDLGDIFISQERHSFKPAQENNWNEIVFSRNEIESKLFENNYGRYHYANTYIASLKLFHFHDTSPTAAIKQPCSLHDNRSLQENGNNLAAFLYLLQEKYPAVLHQIEAVVRSVAPFFDRFMLAPSQLNEEMIRLEWREKDSDMPMFAMHLSDGTLRFIALATLLLQPNLPSVIIIDEPELGLHPFAINKLAGLIQKAAATSQVIISTQSVNLVDNFEPEDVITVDREGKETIFERQSSTALQGWLEEYSLSDLWNKNVIGGRP